LKVITSGSRICDLFCRDIRAVAVRNVDGGVVKCKSLRKRKRIKDGRYCSRIIVTVMTNVVIRLNEI